MSHRFRQGFPSAPTDAAPSAPAEASATTASTAAKVTTARTAPGGPGGPGAPSATAQHQAPTASTSTRERTLPAQLAGLEGRAPTRSGIAHARDKMRHRRWEFAVPFFQAGRTEQAIGPHDVAHPRYARVDHHSIAPEVPPPQHARIERYANRAQQRASGKTAPPRNTASSCDEGRDIVRQITAATGAGALGRLVDDAFGTAAPPIWNPPAPTMPLENAWQPLPPTMLLEEVAAALHWQPANGPAPGPANGPASGPAPGPANVGAASDPGAKLTRRLAELGGPPQGGETMHGALLATALLRAGVDHPQLALDVLDRCASLPLETLTSPPALDALDGHGQRAVQLMAILARGNGCNFDALAALRAHAGHPIGEDGRARALQALLGAADHRRMAAQGARDGARPTVPGGAMQLTNPPTTAAQALTRALSEGLRAAPRRVGASLPERTLQAAARRLTENPDALPESQRYDLFCWRQGDRDDAPGSDLARKNHRLEKFVTRTIPRAAQSQWDRARNLPRRMMGWDKSPLSAATLGLGGVPRDTLQKEQAQHAAGMRAALVALTQSHDAAPPPLDAGKALRHADAVGSMVELAALHVWLEGGLSKDRVAEQDLPRIAAKALELARAAAPNAAAGDGKTAAALATLRSLAERDGATLRSARPFRTLVKRHYTADSLERWGKIAGMPAGATPFWSQVERLRHFAKPEERRLEERSVDASRDLLVEIIGSLKSGSRLRLSDGHRYGASTRGLSVTLSNLLHLSSVPLSAQINARISRGKEAVVEISRATHGIEIFIGTTQRLSGQLDAGAFAGYRFDMGLAEARAGGAVNVMFINGERETSDGVCIGIGRRVNAAGTGYEDAEMLEKAAAVLSELFAQANAPAPPGAAAQAPAGARPGAVPTAAAPGAAPAAATPGGKAQQVFAGHFDDPDLTLSWTSTRDKVYSTGLSATAGIAVRLPSAQADDGTHKLVPLGLGPTAGVAYIRDVLRQRDTLTGPADAGQPTATRQDARRVEQHANGGGGRWIGRFGVGANANTTVNVGESGRSIGLGVLTLDTPAMHTAFRNTRMTARVQLVRDAQRLNHRACILDREFASPSAYIQTVESEREAWVTLFAAQEVADGQSNRAVRAAAHAKIDRHLANARANWRPNQTLFTRHRLREHAARALDLHAALRDQLVPTARDTPEALRALAQADARILEDAASYMPIEFKGKESVNHERLIGPNAFLHLGARKAVASTREFVTQNVSFATMEELDATLPRGQSARRA